MIFSMVLHTVQCFVSKKEQMEKKKRANVRANDVAMKEKEKHTEMLLIKQCLSPFFFFHAMKPVSLYFAHLFLLY